MDSLTQILIGIATVEATVGNKLGNRSFVYGAVLGTLPDLDIAAGWLVDSATAAAFHRSFTHSFLGILLLSPIFGWLLHRLERTRLNFWPATWVVAATFATHIAIDLFTAWGVQLLYPFPTRFSFKTIFVIDLFYTLIWLIALFFVFKNSGSWRKRYLHYGLLCSTAYLGLGVLAKLYAVNQFKKELDRQAIEYVDLIVKPSISNCLLWQANVKTKEEFALADFALTDNQPIVFTRYARNTEKETPFENFREFQRLQQVCEGWYTVSEENGTYYFNDLRFGVLPNEQSAAEPRFVFSYSLVKSNGHLAVKEREKTAREGKKILDRMVKRIQNRGALPVDFNALK